MRRSETDLIHRAIELLNRLVPDDKGRADGPAPRRCPVMRFAQEYLAHDPAADVSCSELWRFFREIADAGELPRVPKAAFLRRLPGAMESVFCVRKSHNIERAGRRVRGFKSVTFREEPCPSPATLELGPE
jgi:hypothetical protein